MAQVSPTLTPPETSVGTELWYSTESTPTTADSLKQIFLVQEIPEFDPAPEGVTYTCLENPHEGTAKGTSKTQNIVVPVLLSKAQHSELKALADASTTIYFWIKLPDSTAEEEGKPLTYKFSGTIYLNLDTVSGNGMLQEKITIYRDPNVTEQEGLPTVT